MFLKKFYHKPTQLAYLLFPKHETPEDVAALLHGVREEIGVKPPAVFELRHIADGPYWGNGLLKFKLHPSIPFEQKDWTEIDRDIAKNLQPEPYKLQP